MAITGGERLDQSRGLMQQRDAIEDCTARLSTGKSGGLTSRLRCHTSMNTLPTNREFAQLNNRRTVAKYLCTIFEAISQYNIAPSKGGNTIPSCALVLLYVCS